MNRRQARENAFIAMFELSFGGALGEIIEYSQTEAGQYALDEYGADLLRCFKKNEEAVNETIAARLKKWTAHRIPRVNMAILRLAVTEMQYASQDLESVIINEAVELSKKYGDEGDYQFINGVLGAIARQEEATAPTPEAGE